MSAKPTKVTAAASDLELANWLKHLEALEAEFAAIIGLARGLAPYSVNISVHTASDGIGIRDGGSQYMATGFVKPSGPPHIELRVAPGLGQQLPKSITIELKDGG